MIHTKLHVIVSPMLATDPLDLTPHRMPELYVIEEHASWKQDNA